MVRTAWVIQFLQRQHDVTCDPGKECLHECGLAPQPHVVVALSQAPRSVAAVDQSGDEVGRYAGTTTADGVLLWWPAPYAGHFTGLIGDDDRPGVEGEQELAAGGSVRGGPEAARQHGDEVAQEGDGVRDPQNVYDSAGRVTSQTDPLGRTTTFAYSGQSFSASGGTTTITDPNGNEEIEQYVDGELVDQRKNHDVLAEARRPLTE